jgi:hypothetical protein
MVIRTGERKPDKSSLECHNSRMIRAGLPTATTFAGKSILTTAISAPTIVSYGKDQDVILSDVKSRSSLPHIFRSS